MVERPEMVVIARLAFALACALPAALSAADSPPFSALRFGFRFTQPDKVAGDARGIGEEPCGV